MRRRQKAALGAATLVSALVASGAAIAQPVADACARDSYKNVSGHCVHRPTGSPAGATARCVDSTYSYSEHASGTCSRHGGVARWIRHP